MGTVHYSQASQLAASGRHLLKDMSNFFGARINTPQSVGVTHRLPTIDLSKRDISKFLRGCAESLGRVAGRTPLGTLISGVVLGWLGSALQRRLTRETSEWESVFDDDDEDDELDNAQMVDTGEESKMVLCVRTDLGMSKGKIAAQAGHATLGAYNKAKRMAPGLVRRWERDSQPKIALAIKGANQARDLEERARAASLPTYVVHDAGRTQIAAVSEKYKRGLEANTNICDTGELDCACNWTSA